MNIKNSEISDLEKIFGLYRVASEYMKSKNQVAWPEFEKQMIIAEINDLRQWKLLINGVVACIWATTLNDELIWGTQDKEPSIYIHRIATSPDFRGQKLTKHIVHWADAYCQEHDLTHVRLDTVGLNKGLIAHYENLGFTFLGAKELMNTVGLPQHYQEGPVCLFQRTVK